MVSSVVWNFVKRKKTQGEMAGKSWAKKAGPGTRTRAPRKVGGPTLSPKKERVRLRQARRPGHSRFSISHESKLDRNGGSNTSSDPAGLSSDRTENRHSSHHRMRTKCRCSRCAAFLVYLRELNDGGGKSESPESTHDQPEGRMSGSFRDVMRQNKRTVYLV